MSKINKKFQKPKNSLKVIKRILSYFKDFKIQLFVVIFCIIITSLSRVIGNGSIKIIVDNFIVPLTKDYNSILLEKFIYTLIIIGCIFLFGVFSSYLYTKIMKKNKFMEGNNNEKKYFGSIILLLSYFFWRL